MEQSIYSVPHVSASASPESVPSDPESQTQDQGSELERGEDRARQEELMINKTTGDLFQYKSDISTASLFF